MDKDKDYLKEFCKDMPEIQPVDPKDYIPIDMYPGNTFYVGKKTDLQHQTLMLKHLAGSDLRELKRLLEQWFTIYPDKKYLIKQIRKCTINLRRSSHNNILYKVTQGQLDVLSQFVDEHTINDISTKPQSENLSLPQIALMFAYNRDLLQHPDSDINDTAKNIAAKYGYTSGTSGLQLYRHWKRFWKAPTERTGVEGKKNIDARIKDINKILPYLTERNEADQDLKTLNDKL